MKPIHTFCIIRKFKEKNNNIFTLKLCFIFHFNFFFYSLLHVFHILVEDFSLTISHFLGDILVSKFVGIGSYQSHGQRFSAN